MIRLSQIIETFEEAFLAQYEDCLLPSHLKALAAMKRCRNALSLQMQAQCPECDRQIRVPHSCGHRHCPHCQHHESEQWLQRQLQKQVPAELRSLAFQHQRVVYSAMIQCGWETLRTSSRNDPRLKGSAGAVSVLHTHSRRLDFHPHVHWVVPAAAVDAEKKHWQTKQGYLFNHQALAKVFRAKMLESLTREGLRLPAEYPKQWVVDCKSVGSGEKALVYLGRYLYRGVIREQDILACENGQVTFRYRNAQSGQWERRTLSDHHLGLWSQPHYPRGSHQQGVCLGARHRCCGLLPCRCPMGCRHRHRLHGGISPHQHYHRRHRSLSWSSPGVLAAWWVRKRWLLPS